MTSHTNSVFWGETKFEEPVFTSFDRDDFETSILDVYYYYSNLYFLTFVKIDKEKMKKKIAGSVRYVGNIHGDLKTEGNISHAFKGC